MSADPKPAAWTLQSELDARKTTCSAHLWFSDPKNSAWAPLYTAESLSALVADAERYRWLRSAGTGPASIWELVSDDANPPYMTLKCGADLDAAIDAARGTAQVCTYPDCNCPFDAPADPNWCAKGLPHAPRKLHNATGEARPQGAER